MSFSFGRCASNLPEPVDCPDCRLQIRTAHRNEQYMYHAVSALSAKRMISLYAAQPPWGTPFTVYSEEEWHGDSWDALSYGADYDFSRPFFEQFFELQKRVPRLGLVTIANENSPYTTGTGYCRNCHLINCSEYCEDCYYGKLLQKCRDCVDCSYAYNSELCYGCFSIYDCYACTCLSYSQNCRDCWFSENLVGCRDCLFCTNLQQQSCCVYNKQVAPAEFRRLLSALGGQHSEFEKARAIWHRMRRGRIHKYANITRSENCTGDFIIGSKNCLDCFDVNDSEDCRYVCVGVNVKDMVDCSNVYLRQELNYQMLGTIGAFHCAFSIYVFHSSDVLYSDHIYHSRSLFGCCGLKHKEYCILNRQYSREEYEVLVPRIIEHMKNTGEWGCFFPVEKSPYAYNETLAFDYFPLSREDVQRRGWNWRDDEDKLPGKGVEDVLPDAVSSASDEITSLVLRCQASGQPYKIIPQELQFCRRQNIALPRRAPMQRHRDREALRNKRRVWPRICSNCEARVMSSYEPGTEERICCEECYRKLVF